MSPVLRKRSRKKLPELAILLESIRSRVETPDFVSNDPVLFMHLFESKRDREIAGFLAALMAWGRRDVVLRKTGELFERMQYRPLEYVLEYNPGRSADFRTFRHRTFTGRDIHGLLTALQIIYRNEEDFESFWAACGRQSKSDGRPLLSVFRDRFLSLTPELHRNTFRHIPSPCRGGACKRLSMFLRWSIRRNSPVDPGIWTFITPSELFIPFDVHVASQSRRLGLLTRKSNDWLSVVELTSRLRIMNPEDPLRYDFALFGMGALGHRLPSRFLLNRV